jgi:hypothetical protein
VTSTIPRAGNPRVKRGIIALGALVLIAVLVYQFWKAQQPLKGGDPHNNIPQLQAVKTYDYVGGDHTKDPVKYAQSPPVGGPHDPVWDDCGAYDAPVRNENAVHDLEHGTVWVTYQPGLPSSDVAFLQNQLEQLKSGKWMLSPYPGMSAPVVITVWNAQLDLNGAHDSRLPIFLNYYGDGHTGPEAAFASCQSDQRVMASPTHP